MNGASHVNKSHTNMGLISQTDVGEDAQDWHLTVFRDVEARLSNPHFPCVFSLNAFRKQLLKFVFVETSDEDGIQHLADGLKDYVELSKQWEGRLDTAYPLVVAFSLEAIDARSVEEYQAFGWRVLERLHQLDPAPWPETVSRNPESVSWSMCFDGMPLFCNMSTPAHRSRRSRNLGRHFVFIINPRERFDIFAGDTPRGRSTRTNIRRRINRYDTIPHSQQLGSYGAGGLEWTQYGLSDDNLTPASRCPFTFRDP
jgi:FPC/CPF motif-containing protein YcgG